MPASAVARRTPAIGGRAASVFGASGETGWDMRVERVEQQGRFRLAPMAPRARMRKAQANGRPAQADGGGVSPRRAAVDRRRGAADDATAWSRGLAGRGGEPCGAT